MQDSTRLRNNPLMTFKEAADYLRISERTLWGLTAPRGDLPCIHFGRCVRYCPSDLSDWISSHQRKELK